MTVTAAALADHLNLHPRVRDGGINFARRATKTNKMHARHQVEAMFTRRRWDRGLSILTMPSLDWQFEKNLIHSREHGRGLLRPRQTFITSIERSPYVYKAAIGSMPGAQSSLSAAVAVPAFAKQACKTFSVGRYFQCELSDIAEHYATGDKWFDAAWVDLTGPLSFQYLDTLLNLWSRIRSVLVVTSLRARWSAEFGQAMTEAGGLASLLAEDLIGAVPVSDYEYMDTSPMSQIVLRRVVLP